MISIPASTPLLFDGAFATYYFSLTGETAPCEQANLTSPDIVKDIHRSYLKAGARCLTTNTFAANPQNVPDGNELREMIHTGYALACTAAEEVPDALVFADIGGVTGKTASEDYRIVAEYFVSVGATHFLFETLAELDSLTPTLEWLRSACPDAVIIVSFAVSADGYTRRGLFYRTLLEQCEPLPVDAIGLNCLCGPSHMVSLFEKLPAMKKPLLAMPNAGYPSKLNGRLCFEDNAEYFAKKLVQLYTAGADILGGCCGTTPQHIAMAWERLKNTPERPQKPPVLATATAVPHTAPVTHKRIAVELDPPQTLDSKYFLDGALQLRDRGVDWITIADSPLARARADSLMMAAKLHRETGIDVLPHLSCRDRNQIGVKAALLGAAMEDIHTVLVITGDTPADGKGGVFQFHSASMMRYISELNAQVFSQSPFTLAGALNINAVNFSVELERAKRKLDNGASMLLTQPVFEDAAVENLQRAKSCLDCVILAGILPVAGYKNALFLSNEVTGIAIPATFLDELRQSTPEEAKQRSIDFSFEIVKRVYDFTDGFYIMTPLRKTEIVCGLLDRIQHYEKGVHI